MCATGEFRTIVEVPCSSQLGPRLTKEAGVAGLEQVETDETKFGT